MEGEVLWEQGARVTAFLGRMREWVARDHVRRYWSNGQPYWVRTEGTDEK